MKKLILMFVTTLIIAAPNPGHAASAADQQRLDELVDKLSTEQKKCQEVLEVDEYVSSEQLLGTERVSVGASSKEIDIMICGYHDPRFLAAGEAKYANVVVINPRSHKFGLSKLKGLVDKYGKSGVVVTHIVIDPSTPIEELTGWPSH